MEIKYSNAYLDSNIFQKDLIYGVYDKNSNFIANRFSDAVTIKYNPKIKVKYFLICLKTSKRKLLKNIKKEFSIKSIENKKMRELSSFELACVLIIKAILSKSNYIILDHIDPFLTSSDFKQIILYIKNSIEDIDKVVMISVNKIDNMIAITNNYVVASEDRIIYNGQNIESIHEPTEIMKFVNAANEKGANLKYYKDPSDLLKAIYRSVKK